jgi:hypothetical protein
MSSDRVQRCLQAGTSILVGSVDRRGTPASCRGIAMCSSDDLRTATVYLPVATSRDTIANVATTGRIAVAATHVVEHDSVQIKGATRNIRLATEEERPLIEARLLAFGKVVEPLGLPLHITGSVNCWPAFAIEIEVEHIYEQTPGPRAGQQIQ